MNGRKKKDQEYAALAAAAKSGTSPEQEFISISEERIYQLGNGALKTRLLGKPVHKPSGREKVSQVPLEWKRQQHSKEE